jgi:dephospho-CoA kinase
MKKDKLKVAVTGGIGTGKSYASKIFEKNKIPVIRADDLAKEILKTEEEVKEQIIDTFGEEAYKSGKLNTKFLADQVFTSQENVDKINAIVHPVVIDRLRTIMNQTLVSNDIVVTEAALIFDAKMEKYFDYTILLVSDEEEKIKRVTQRDGVSEEEVRRRMKFQMDDERKKQKADFIVENSANLNDLEEKVNFFISMFRNIVKESKKGNRYGS